MKIFLDGYADRNLGDDLMLTLAAKGLSGHEIYTGMNMPDMENVRKTKVKSGFDCYLRVTGSGFQIYNNLGILYRLCDMARERRYAKTRAVIGCNISSFINSAAESAIRANLRQYDFITVRDSFSLDYIRKNIPSARCEKYPDIVFSIPDEMIPAAACENLLGISVTRGTDYTLLAETADRYINETGNGVLLLCFDTGSENDASAAEQIRGFAINKSMIEIVKYETIPQILSEMKRCGVILGIRFHSCILSARMNIPFVAAADSDKLTNTLNDLHYSGRIYSPYDFNPKRVLEDILNAKPLNLDKAVFSDARKHIGTFNEFLLQQD